MLNTLVYLWEYAYSHPRATNLGIRREYERIPKMSANPTPACSLLIAVRDAWQAAHRSAVPPRAVRPGSGVSLAAAPCCHAVEPGGDDPPPCAAPGFRAAVHTEAASGVQAGARFSWVQPVYELYPGQEGGTAGGVRSRIPTARLGGNTRIPTPRKPLWEYVEYVFNI